MWRFSSNLYTSIVFLYKRRRDTGPRLLMPLFNVVPNLRAWPGFANCTAFAVMNTMIMALGVPAITAILFIRAYYTWMQRTWLAHSCWMGTNTIWSMSKFAADMVTNITLSGLYLRVLRRTLGKRISSSLYLKLYHEGLFSSFLVTISSIFTAVVVLLRLVPDYEAFIYGLDNVNRRCCQPDVINATIISKMICQHTPKSNTNAAVYSAGCSRRPVIVCRDFNGHSTMPVSRDADGHSNGT
ncbi:hypothetical protein THASP1DRAFT_23953 [Thamnocephalis sphaerospora]|uniref:Uncharacterized protein n=1 Tax=Thamnocephalis sphaerospora TaxID=78915 RepID=A0A4P9XPN7_9FUNG|nr:hypothetical protein THASP1DRAFT_23953 [Thamnocephalis sphaerospora]|eukprot:RKP07973.1 hypothetical protein THASP1DRAFT_23953 [Thamnocephalis sphaerospora]